MCIHMSVDTRLYGGGTYAFGLYKISVVMFVYALKKPHGDGHDSVGSVFAYD